MNIENYPADVRHYGTDKTTNLEIIDKFIKEGFVYDREDDIFSKKYVTRHSKEYEYVHIHFRLHLMGNHKLRISLYANSYSNLIHTGFEFDEAMTVIRSEVYKLFSKYGI